MRACAGQRDPGGRRAIPHLVYRMAMAWAVETLNETVDAELAELPADMRARLV